jgi:UPF0716 protein FxsA
MRLILLIAFIVVPLAELAILIKLGSQFGFWPTFGLIVTTAIIGSTVLRHQGFAVLRRTEQAMSRGQPPVEPVIDGVLLLAAGAFLISPGLITDTVGLVLLVPPVRRFLAKSAFKRMFGPMTGDLNATDPAKRKSDSRSPGARSAAGDKSANPPRRDGQGPVIDGDYERLD